MSILLSAHQLSKSFAARALFQKLTFTIESGDRIGLIGPNGAGKSTLLKILAGLEHLDSGTLSFQKGCRIGLLSQVPQFTEGATIWSTMMESIPESKRDEDWDAMGRAHEYISRLGLDKYPEDTLVAKLSGGWQKRVALGRELVKHPDLLLLDEPTNHLDLETILWLENFLARAPFATLIITHDRLFLQKISNRILELDPRHEGGLLSISGDYATYLDVRSQLIQAQERREIILKNTLRRETEWLRRGAKARTTKQQARIKQAGVLSDEVEELGVRNQNRLARLEFQEAGRTPKKLIEAKNISKVFGDKTLFKNINITLTPGTRLGLLGANGAGKSTLIRVLLGEEEPTTGTVVHSDQLSVAYFDQKRDVLDPKETLAKSICPAGEYVKYRGNHVHIRGYLDRFLFTQAQMDMQVGKLSGGEQSRVLIARLMLTQAHLLVLDEPTNDLDIATLGVLEECLSDFPGAVILVTHDRYFLDQIATQILAFPPAPHGHGNLETFVGLEQWENWISELTAPKPKAKSESSNGNAKNSAVSTPKKVKLTFQEQREFESMESTIHKLEAELMEVSGQSLLPENQSNASQLAKCTQKMGELQNQIDSLYARWSDLEKRNQP